LIRLSVPGSLEYRDVAVRVVGTACRLLRPPAADASRPLDNGAESPDAATRDFTQDEFAQQVVSAFSEAFNNVVIHGYRDAPKSVVRRIDVEISAEGAEIAILIRDWGNVYDPRAHAELPDELPERGMGLFIIRSFMDVTEYEAGPPNVLLLKKKLP
jgi:serine/threonine-protein kinase RsbW